METPVKTNMQIVSEHYAALARQNVAAMMVDVSPEVTWTEMAGFPCAGTWIGPDQVVTHVFSVLGSEWENYNCALEKIIYGGEQLVAIGTYSGTFRKTNKPMQAHAGPCFACVAHCYRQDRQLRAIHRHFAGSASHAGLNLEVTATRKIFTGIHPTASHRNKR